MRTTQMSTVVSQSSAAMISSSVVSLLLSALLQMWMMSVVMGCYRYIRDKTIHKAMSAGAADYNSIEK